MGLVSKKNGDGSYIFENKGMVSKKVQNFDEVTDIWLVAFLFRSIAIWDSLLSHEKKDITITDNLRYCNLRWLSWSEQLVQKFSNNNQLY